MSLEIRMEFQTFPSALIVKKNCYSAKTLQKYFVLERGTIRSKFLLFFQSGARLVDHGCLI